MARGYGTAVRDAITDRGASRALADCLRGRSATLTNMGRFAEAADDGRRSLTLARELGYPAGQALALAALSIAAYDSDDLGSAVQLARYAEKITADIPAWIARVRSYFLTEVLTAADELAAAERVCAAGLARSREAGDLWNQVGLLPKMAILDLRAARIGDAAALLREALQIAARTGARGDAFDCLDRCGYLCAVTGRCAEALTMWAATAALLGQEGFPEAAPYTRRRQEPLRQARQTLGPARARAAEERGAAMSLDTAAEYALMLTAPGPRQPPAPCGSGQLVGERHRQMLAAASRRQPRRGGKDVRQPGPRKASAQSSVASPRRLPPAPARACLQTLSMFPPRMRAPQARTLVQESDQVPPARRA